METAIEHVQLVFRERPHMQSGPAAAWITHPAGAVVQLTRPARVTLEVSSFIVQVYEEVVRRFPDNHALTIVLDFSMMLGRTTASRTQLLGCMREAAQRVGRVYLALPAELRPALRRSFEASLQIAGELGVDARLTGSARQAVASCAMVCAPASI